MNCRGAKRSRASSAESRGKPWNDVFAARISTISVKPLHGVVHEARRRPRWNTARAICETTESVELGRAWRCTARYETPRKSVIAITPSTPSVFAAFFPCGWRNALTPFAIASTPVRAVEPDENARSRTNSVIAPVPTGSACGVTA